MSGYRILYHHRIRAEDGQAMHVRELIGALRAEGHEVEECALVPKANGAEQSSGAASFWSRVSVPRVVTEAMEVAYNRTGIKMLREAVARQRPDFLYERHALHLYAGLVVAREAGIPLLLEVNSPMVDEMTRLKKLWFRGRASGVERRVLGEADRVFPVTGVLRDWLVRCGAREEACRVVHNGAELERYDDAARQGAAELRRRHGLDDDTVVLGFVGFMRDWHRLDFAVDALARPELAKVKILLVGTGPALEQILQRAQDRGVADRIVSVGAVAPADVPRHVLAFDIGMIPAINPYSSPLKLFDYSAAGVATIAPRQPNVCETIEDGVDGALFEPDNGASFGDRLVELVTDSGRTQELGAAGHRRLVDEDWTWRGNARRVVAAFEEVRG